ncbi:MAG: PAS domain-containing protein [bacterium]|jgi:PAS domain S-box-containing protein
MWSETDGALLADKFTLPACEVDGQLRVVSFNNAFCNTFGHSFDALSGTITLRRLLGTAQVEKVRAILSESDHHLTATPLPVTVLSGEGRSIKCHMHLGLTGETPPRSGLLFFLPQTDADSDQTSAEISLYRNRIESFWKALPGGVIAVSSDGRMEDFNDAALAMLEYMPGDLWHRMIEMICPELSSFERFMRDDTRGRPSTLTLVTKRGELLAVRASLLGFPRENQPPYLFCFAEEGAGLYRRAWQKSESHLRSLIENLHDGIALTDRDFHIRLCNGRLALMLNYPKELLRGTDLAAFLQECSGSTFKLPLACLLSGETLQQNVTLFDRNKNSHAVHLTIIPLTEPDDHLPEAAVVIRDITSSRQAAEKLHQQREILKRLSGEIIKAQEQERQSISRELHDNIAQKLAVAQLKIGALATTMRGTEKKELEGATSLLEEIAVDIRHIAADLRPQILDDLGLIPAMEWYLEEFLRCSRIQADIRVEGESRPLSKVAEINLFRIFQELLLNAARHSGANKIEVNFRFCAEYVTLIVADNGCGFKNDIRDSERLRNTPHFGLLNISERLTYLGGDITLEDREGGGARIRIRVPG